MAKPILLRHDRELAVVAVAPRRDVVVERERERVASVEAAPGDVREDEGAVERDGEERELVQMLLRFRFLLSDPDREQERVQRRSITGRRRSRVESSRRMERRVWKQF